MITLLLLVLALFQPPAASSGCPRGWSFNAASEHCEFWSPVNAVSQAEERERYTEWLRLRRAFVDACERTPLAFACARPLTPYASEPERGTFTLSIRK